MRIKTLSAAVLITLFLCGCSEAKPVSETVFAMDTVMEFTAYGEGADDAVNLAVQAVRRLDGLLSATDPNSEVFALNSGETVELSPDTAVLLTKSLAISTLTGGAVDITIYPIVKAWGFTTSEYTIPQPSTISDLLEKVGYNKVVFDGNTRTVSLPEGMEIDFGAVAKGYASDVCVKEMTSTGVKSALINLGGNVCAIGTKTDGTPWNIAIKDPNNSDKYLGLLSVADKAVVTSGGYERYFTGDDGEVYWHIMDPSAGMPAKSGLISVTVICESGVYADGLSTALFVMGKERAIEFWREFGGFDAVLVSDDGQVYITSGIENSFTLRDTDLYTLSIFE